MTSAVLAGSAVAAALATAMVVRGSGGWASLAWVPLCLVAGALHSVINVRLARRVWSRRVIALSLTSSALFLLAFFLQVDVGDGPSWIVGSAWFERAVLRGTRRSGVARAVGMAQRSGIPAASDAELAKLRKELSKRA